MYRLPSYGTRVSWDTAGSTSCPHCAQYHGRRNSDVGPGETWARTWVRVRRRGWVQLLFAFMVGTKEKRGMCNPKQREECLSPPRPSFPPHMHTHTSPPLSPPRDSPTINQRPWMCTTKPSYFLLKCRRTPRPTHSPDPRRASVWPRAAKQCEFVRS